MPHPIINGNAGNVILSPEHTSHMKTSQNIISNVYSGVTN